MLTNTGIESMTAESYNTIHFEHPEHSVIGDFEHYSFEHSDFEHYENMAQHGFLLPSHSLHFSQADEDMTKSKGKDPLEGLGGPMTRARARKAKEALQQVLSILFEYKPKFQGEKSKVVSCIMAQMEED